MMGVILEQTAGMQPYEAEVRRESFYLYSYHDHHNITVYPDTNNPRVGTIEILLEDIPNIRAALDAIEHYVRNRP